MLLISLSSCSDMESTSQPIITSYTSPFPKKAKNLTNILGDEFTIITEQEDTVTYSVTWDKKTRISKIISKDSGNTLFEGLVSKYKRRYYFSTERNDSTYWIHAIEIRDGKIRGLKSEYDQVAHLDWTMRWLTGFDEEIWKSKTKMIKYISEDHIRLVPDKKEIERFCVSRLAGWHADTILKWEEPIQSAESIEEEELDEEEILRSNTVLIDKIYPNPAAEQCTIELQESGEFELEIIDVSGRIMQTEILKEQINQVKLTNLTAGTYIVRVHSTDGMRIDTRKMIVR